MTILFSKRLGTFQSTKMYFLSLLLCAVLLFLAGLGNRHLWGSDQPRVAGIAAEMARSGDLVVPRLNGEPFLEKPPLFFWAASATYSLLGENAYTARIPSALAAESIFSFSLNFFQEFPGPYMMGIDFQNLSELFARLLHFPPICVEQTQ